MHPDPASPSRPPPAPCPRGVVRARRLAASSLLALAAGGCGYAAISIEAGTGFENAWLTIEWGGHWGAGATVSEAAIALRGSASAPPGLPCGTYGLPIPGYRVTWSNLATGEEGHAEIWLDCLNTQVMLWHIPAIPLALGENPVQVRMRDPNGRVASDGITVQRVP